MTSTVPSPTRWPGRARLAAALLVLALGAPPALALSVRPLSLAERTRLAAAVVVADVEKTSLEAAPDGALRERIVLSVREVWKRSGGRDGSGPAAGRRHEILAYLGQGGPAGVRGVAGLPRLSAGRRYVLFLPAPGEAAPLPAFVGGEAGALVVEGAGGLRGLDGRAVVGIGERDLVYENREPRPVGEMRAGSGVVLRPHQGLSTRPPGPRGLLDALRTRVRRAR